MSWRNPLQWGWFGSYDKAENEVEGVSTKPDPYAYRGGVLDEFKGKVTNLLKISANWIRKATGVHDEQAYLMFRVIGEGADEEGAVYVAVRGRGREQSDERLFIGHSSIISHVPFLAPRLIGKMSRFYTDHDRYMINWQDDSGLPTAIVYRVDETKPEAQWVAIGRLKIDPL